MFNAENGKRKLKRQNKKNPGIFYIITVGGGGGGAAYQRAVLKGFRTFARIRFSNIVYFPNSFNPEKKKIYYYDDSIKDEFQRFKID